MGRTFAATAFIVAVGALLVVPFHPEAPVLGLLHSRTPDTPAARRVDWLLVESGGNFVVFAAVGAAALFVVGRPPVAVALGCLLSALAESVQLVIPHRVASLTDLATNCLGVLSGVALAWAASRVIARRRSASPAVEPV